MPLGLDFGVPFVAGLALVAVAAALLLVDRRSAATRAFALVLTGRGIAAFSAALTGTGLGVAFNRFAYAFVFIPSAAAIYFASTYPRRRGWLGRSRWGWLALAVPTAVLSAMVAANPALYVDYSVVDGRLLANGIGPLWVWAIGALFLVFAGVGTLFARDAALATTPPARRTLSVISLGFILEGVFTLTSVLAGTFLLGAFPFGDVDPRPFNFIGFAGLGLSALAVGVVVWRSARERSVFAVATVAAVALAVASGVQVGLATGVGVIESQLGTAARGAWRLVLPATVAYALLRVNLFDVDLKVKRAIERGAIVGAYVLLFGIAAYVWTAFVGVGLGLGAGFATAAVGLVALKPVRAGAARLANAAMPEADDSTEYVVMRKLEVYRHALDEAKAKGVGDLAHEPFLSDLRKRLDIGLETHHALVLNLGAGRAHEPVEPGLSPAMKGKFRIERELGRGGFGKVLLAHDTDLDRKVVLKQPAGLFAQDAQARDLFLKEAQLAAKIRHPNVVGVYDVLRDGDLPVLVLEYVEGGSIESLLKARRTLSPGEVERIALDCLAGLDRIHREGIVHRDIKPGNVLLDAEGVAKITDFGIAHAPVASAAFLTVAGTGYQPGSLAYMSPEQVRGDPVDARSDLYSLAVLMHECLTGRHYLGPTDESDFKLRTKVQTAPLEMVLALVPPRIAAVLARASEKDPAKRYANAAEMSAALAPARLRAA